MVLWVEVITQPTAKSLFLSFIIFEGAVQVKDGRSREGWYCFNDKSVTKINEYSVATPNAYILFYAKQGTLQPS